MLTETDLQAIRERAAKCKEARISYSSHDFESLLAEVVRLRDALDRIYQDTMSRLRERSAAVAAAISAKHALHGEPDPPVLLQDE